MVLSRTTGAPMRLHGGAKPFEQLVAEAFDGPVLRLSRRIKVLEIAEERQIRRGEALDVIEAVQRDIETKHAIRRPGGTIVFLKRFVVFAAAYAVVALAWCLIL
jgi:hypothetical protein